MRSKQLGRNMLKVQDPSQLLTYLQQLLTRRFVSVFMHERMAPTVNTIFSKRLLYRRNVTDIVMPFKFMRAIFYCFHKKIKNIEKYGDRRVEPKNYFEYDVTVS